MRASRRGTFSLARNLAIYLCRTVGGCGLREIAGEFRSLGYSGVARVVGRLKTKMKTDRAISRRLLKIRDILAIKKKMS